MLKKYLLLGCVAAALAACDSPSLDKGPINTSFPTPPEPTVSFTTDWAFTTEAELTSWTVEWSKPGSSDAFDSEIFHHANQNVLAIAPYWGGTDVAKLDNVTVYGMLAEPKNMEYGTIYMSLYMPREHLGNPWGTGPYWGESAHHLGTQYLVIDSNGNRALLDTGNGSGDWINSFDIGGSSYQRGDTNDVVVEHTTERDNFGPLTQGAWFDLAIKPETTFYPADDNTSDFDLTSVVGFGVTFNYALEKPENHPEDWATNGASDKYLYIDNVALVEATAPPPPPAEVMPPAAIPITLDTPAPEFGKLISNEGLESGYSEWVSNGSYWVWAAPEAAKTGNSGIKVTYSSGGATFGVGIDPAADLTSVSTLDFSVWAKPASGSGVTNLKFSLCDDCDSGVEVAVPQDGSWLNVSLPVSSLTDADSSSVLFVKNLSGGQRVVYLDELGFDKVPDMVAPTFALPVYLDDTPEAGFSAWNGWGGTYTFNHELKAETGPSAILLEYVGGYGSAQIGASAVDISAQATLNFSAFMPAGGDETATLVVQLCGGNGNGCGDNDGVQALVTAGQWTHFTLPLSDFLDTGGTINELRFKNFSDSDKTMVIDNVGFDVNYQPQFTIPVYGEVIGAGFSAWNGWGGTYDFASENMVQTGLVSFEALYTGGYGSAQLGVSDVDISGVTNFQFSAYYDGEGDTTLLIQLCGGGIGCGDNDGVQAIVAGGQWMDFSMPVSDFLAIPGGTLQELRIKNYTDSDKNIYIDNAGFDLQPLVAYDMPVFYDSMSTGFSAWNGWGGSYNFAYQDMLYHGYNTMELAYTGGYGSMQVGVSDVDVSAASTFGFSAMAAEGTGSTTLLIQLCGGGIGCGDNDGVQVSVSDAGWQTFTLNLADFPDFGGTLQELRIKNYTDSDKTIYVDNIGFNE